MNEFLQRLLAQVAHCETLVVFHDAARVNQAVVSDRPGEVLVPAEMEVGVWL